ncbi:MAG: hypothetical protein M2R45_04976 [Verrucomicrobia subdivision 3 bacterium]|nr:hypothetical protein [Limisphaerales bacterium]MCS1414077.1 hypothetical protein [Limisphaerales bacterium]
MKISLLQRKLTEIPPPIKGRYSVGMFHAFGIYSDNFMCTFYFNSDECLCMLV